MTSKGDPPEPRNVGAARTSPASRADLANGIGQPSRVTATADRQEGRVVSAHIESSERLQRRRARNRAYTAVHRARIARGEFRRTISVSARQVDELERRRYLDSNDRGDVRAESEAIETRCLNRDGPSGRSCERYAAGRRHRGLEPLVLADRRRVTRHRPM